MNYLFHSHFVALDTVSAQKTIQCSVDALSLINLLNYFQLESIAVAAFSTLVRCALIRSGLKIRYDFYIIVGCWVSARGTY